jgi:hypothetical protein
MTSRTNKSRAPEKAAFIDDKKISYGTKEDHGYDTEEGVSLINKRPERMEFLNTQAGQYDVETDYPASDGEYHSQNSLQDLDFGNVPHLKGTMTGRQRKKLAARSKGGEFQVCSLSFFFSSSFLFFFVTINQKIFNFFIVLFYSRLDVKRGELIFVVYAVNLIYKD